MHAAPAHIVIAPLLLFSPLTSPVHHDVLTHTEASMWSDVGLCMTLFKLCHFLCPYFHWQCPALLTISCSLFRYTAASAETRTVFARYDPHFAAGSLDEAYLDVTDFCGRHGLSGEQVGALKDGRLKFVF